MGLRYDLTGEGRGNSCSPGTLSSNVLGLWSPRALVAQRGRESTGSTSGGDSRGTTRRTKPPPNHVVLTGPETSMKLRRTPQIKLQEEKVKKLIEM